MLLVYFFLLALYSAELDWEINSEIGLEIKEFHKKKPIQIKRIHIRVLLNQKYL